ncbi:MAG: hypothetical protein M1836_005974 [Candelina mexicana]|nr:MAG: hypothetical protein M1836_005974 [Candelina mexicana]
MAEDQPRRIKKATGARSAGKVRGKKTPQTDPASSCNDSDSSLSDLGTRTPTPPDGWERPKYPDPTPFAIPPGLPSPMMPLDPNLPRVSTAAASPSSFAPSGSKFTFGEMSGGPSSTPTLASASSAGLSNDWELARLRRDLQFAENKLTEGERQYAHQSQYITDLHMQISNLQKTLSVSGRQFNQIQITLDGFKTELAEADQLAGTQKQVLAFKEQEIANLKEVSENAIARANIADKNANEAENTLRLCQGFAPDVMTAVRRQAELETELQTKNGNMQKLHEHIERLQKDVELARRRRQNGESPPPDADMAAAGEGEVDMLAGEGEVQSEGKSMSSLETELEQGSSKSSGKASKKSQKKKSSKNAVQSPGNKAIEKLVLRIPASKNAAKATGEGQGTESTRQAQKEPDNTSSGIPVSVVPKNKPNDKSQQAEVTGKVEEISKETHKRALEEISSLSGRNSELTKELANKKKVEGRVAELEKEKAKLQELLSKNAGKGKNVNSPDNGKLATLQNEKSKLQQQLQSCEREKAENSKTIAEDIQKLDSLQNEVDKLQKQLKGAEKINNLCRNFKKQLDESKDEMQKTEEKNTKLIANRDLAVETYKKRYERLEKQLEAEREANEAAGNQERMECLHLTIERLKKEKAKLEEQLESHEGESTETGTGATDSEKDETIKKLQQEKEELEEKLEACSDDRRDAELTVSEHKKTLEKLQEEKAEIEKKLNACFDAKVDAETTVTHKDEALKKLQEEIVVLRKDVSFFKDKKDEVEKSILGKSQIIKKLRKEKADVERRLDSCENGKTWVENIILEKDQVIQNLEAEKEELEKQLISCKNRIVELENTISEKDGMIAQVELAKKGVRSQMRTQVLYAEEMVRDERRTVKILKEQKAELEKQLGSYKDGKTEVEKTLTERDQAIERLEKDKQELQAQMDEKISALQRDLENKVKENQEASKRTSEEEARIEQLEREKAELVEEMRKLEATTEESDTDSDEDGYESEEWTPEVAAREIAKNRKAARREKRMEDPAAYAQRYAATGGCHPDDSDYDSEADPSRHKQDATRQEDQDSIFNGSLPGSKEDEETDDEGDDEGDDTLTGIYDDKSRNYSISSVMTILDEPPKQVQNDELKPQAEQTKNAETQTASPTDDDSHLINPQRTLTDVGDIGVQITTIPGLNPPETIIEAAPDNEVIKETIIEVAENVDFIGEKVVIKNIIKENMIYCPYKWWLRPYQDLFLIISLISFADFPTFGSLLFRFGRLHEASWNWFLGFFCIHTNFFSDDDSTPPPSPGPSATPSEGGDNHPDDNDNDNEDEEPYVPKIAPIDPNGEYDTLMTMEPPWAPFMADIYRRRPSLLDTMTFEPVPPMPKGWTKAKFLAGIDDFTSSPSPTNDDGAEEDPFADIYDSDSEPAVAGNDPSLSPSLEAVAAAPTTPAPHLSLKNVLLLLSFHLLTYAFILFWLWDWTRTRSERHVWLSSNELTRQALLSMRTQFRQLHAYSESSFWMFVWGRTPRVAKEVAFEIEKVVGMERRMLG